MFKLIILSVLLVVVTARPSLEIGHVAPLEHHHYPAALSHQSQIVYHGHGHHYGHHGDGIYDHHLVSPLLGHHDGLIASSYLHGYGHGHHADYHHGGYHH